MICIQVALIVAQRILGGDFFTLKKALTVLVQTRLCIVRPLPYMHGDP